MSRFDPPAPRPDLPDDLGLLAVDAGGPNGTSARRRGAASVTFRRGDVDDQSAPSLDPATKSLADALRITFRLLQLAMVVLVALYLLSGFQSVRESERGIRLVMGRIAARDLPPGFQFSLPAPFGELVKIQTGLQTEEINNQFFPKLSEGDEKALVEKDKGAASLVGGSDSLDPDADGHLLTADGNIAHARWSVTFQRADSGKFAANIDPEFERRIVNAAACSGIVQASASLTIDDLLRKQLDTTAAQAGLSKVETLARDAAQQALDRMDSGVQITQLTMTLVIPPRTVMKAFQDVQAAQSKAGRAIEDARNQRNDTLTQAAGEAAPLLIELIDRYELELEKGDPGNADAALALIDRVLSKEEVEIDGERIRPRISGKVSQIIDDARQYRTSSVNRAKADFDMFEAKRAVFRSNPLVMVNSDWSDAFGSLLANETVQAIYLPPDVQRQVLLLNRDPMVNRRLEQERLLKENEEAQKQRILERERARFNQRMDAESKVRDQ